MRIAVASEGRDEDSEISSRGGRAPYYLVFDEKGKLLESISNPFAVGGGGAGFAVAKMLADKNIDTFIAGNIGQNMKGALEERGIRCVIMTGPAKKAAAQAASHIE